MGTPNWANRTIFTGDNLYVMRGMNSESVDLIYADPPFNSNRNYSAPVGSKAAGASFKDTWTLSDLDEAWHNQILDTDESLYHVINASRYSHGEGMMSYLCMMGVRLLEMRRVLKPTGSIYLHCDPYASHYLKLVMDAVFGVEHYLNEISWKRTVPKNDYIQGAMNWPRMRDIILHYRASPTYKGFNQPFAPMSKESADKHYGKVDPETGKRYQLTSLTAPGAGTRGHPEYELLGVTRFWRYNEQKMQKLLEEGRIVQTAPGRVPRYKRYLDESKGVAIGDSWNDIPAVQGRANERVGYPTQKPLALLERIIKASSNEGDTVLDPFAGCATTCVAAAQLDREWVGIDLSPKAVELVNVRLQDTLGSLYHHAFVTARADIPQRTDLADVKPFITQKQWLYGAQDGYCKGCREHFAVQNLTIDHIIPRAKGGTDHVENLQLLCGHCNSLKGDRPMEYLMARLAASNGYVQRYA